MSESYITISQLKDFRDKIKAELSEHCMKLMERMDACHEIEKKEITEYINKESCFILERTNEDKRYLLEWMDTANRLITKHTDEEIARLDTARNDFELQLQEVFVENLADFQKAITKHSYEEISRLKHHAVMYNEYITEHADKEIERITSSTRSNFVAEELTKINKILDM